MITSMLPNAAEAELEDWGPLDKATGAAMARAADRSKP